MVGNIDQKRKSWIQQGTAIMTQPKTSTKSNEWNQIFLLRTKIMKSTR